ncbi:MAG: glycerophosphodiester phosphodiesterase [Deltaproteobacteria bacterium]|nr:glycerophosphodiester phosphodiesterase [Deltaproteobacteria bacterium]
MAHRGGAGLWPENTLYAFEQAISLGADVLETDMHSTADGVLVLIHDDTVDRTTNGSGPVSSYTLEELKKLDAGFWWSRDNGLTFPYRGQGLTIPTLREVLQSLPETPMNIDIKQQTPSLVRPLCQMIRQHRLKDSIVVASFPAKTIRQFRRTCPEVATSAAREEARLFIALATLCRRAAPRSASYHALQLPAFTTHFPLLTRRFVRAAHSHNLQVHIWTVNSIGKMRQLVELGIDGIVTDYPDRLLKMLGRSGKGAGGSA